MPCQVIEVPPHLSGAVCLLAHIGMTVVMVPCDMTHKIGKEVKHRIVEALSGCEAFSDISSSDMIRLYTKDETSSPSKGKARQDSEQAGYTIINEDSTVKGSGLLTGSHVHIQRQDVDGQSHNVLVNMHCISFADRRLGTY